MLNKNNHPYHMVDLSPWPFFVAASTLLMVSGLIELMHMNKTNLLFMSLMATSSIAWMWWRDISREGKLQGLHLIKIMSGLKWGMLLFILSEILFFLSFFWTFFHLSLTPNVEAGSTWPPAGLSAFSYLEIPLLNTIILLSSGVSITWCHASILSDKMSSSSSSLLMTILLGVYFTALQAFEYLEASYSFSDSSFGSSFFLATGFHGLHVIVGSIFLSVTASRLILGGFSTSHHFGFEAAAWYWHFVDVVWLFLFCSIYWWAVN